MDYYNKQLQAMVEALASGKLIPPPNVARSMAQRRINTVSKALSMLNLFVPVAGQFPQANPNSTFTVYSKPLQRDVIVMGCALIAYDQSTFTFSEALTEFRLRLPEPLSHLSQNYLFQPMAFNPALYSVFFPAPFILPASEQIAVDFGFNAPQAGDFVDVTGRIELVLFCVAVKDCLDSADQAIINRAAEVIGSTPYQRRVYLNSFTVGSRAVTQLTNSQFQSNENNAVVFDPQSISTQVVPDGTLTTSETRPADMPLLVTGFMINSATGLIRIMDSGSGHSFTQGDFISYMNLFAAINLQPNEPPTNQGGSTYYSYFRLPVPHLLRPGASLTAEHIATGNNSAGGGTFNPQFMVWECCTP